MGMVRDGMLCPRAPQIVYSSAVSIPVSRIAPLRNVPRNRRRAVPEQEFPPPRRLARSHRADGGDYRPDRDDDDPPRWANMPPVRPASAPRPSAGYPGVPGRPGAPGGQPASAGVPGGRPASAGAAGGRPAGPGGPASPGVPAASGSSGWHGRPEGPVRPGSRGARSGAPGARPEGSGDPGGYGGPGGSRDRFEGPVSPGEPGGSG